MRLLLMTSVFLGLLLSGGNSIAQEGLNENLENPGYLPEPEWFKESFLDIRDDIAEASADGKRLLLYFHQDGCPYCKKLIQDNFGQKQTSDLARKHFDTISINMWGDREVVGLSGDETTEKLFAQSLKVQFTPTILLFDEQGNVVLRINGYYPPKKFIAALEFAGLHKETETDFRSYLASSETEEASGVLHTESWYVQSPLNLTRTKLNNEKPMLVFFEQKQCLACDELHEDILKRSHSAKLLKQFNVAVVDRWSKEPVITPAGQSLESRRWASQLGINYSPALIFFDNNGNEVFRTEAWLRTFHIQSAMEYVLSNSYESQPEFQRFVEARADRMREQGLEVNLLD